MIGFAAPIVFDRHGRIAGDSTAAIYLHRHVFFRDGETQVSRRLAPEGPLPDYARVAYDAAAGARAFYLDVSDPARPAVASWAFAAGPASIGPGHLLLGTALGDAFSSPLAWLDATATDGGGLDPIVPNAICGIEGRPYRIHPHNLFGRNAEGRIKVAAISARSGDGLPVLDVVSTGSSIEVEPGRTGPELIIRAGELGRRSAAQKGVAIASRVRGPAAVAGRSPKVLMIGDSLTQQGSAVTTAQHLRAITGVAPRMIGTMALTNQFAPGPVAHAEGRGGRQFAGHTYEVTDDLAPVPPGQEAAYMAGDFLHKWSRNPFLRVATGSDPAYSVKNGYIFDLRYYLDRFGLEDPTHVVVNLGTNDLSLNPEAVAMSRILRGLDITHSRIRAALPEACIHYVGNALGPADGDARWEGPHRTFLRLLLDFVADRDDPRCVTVPAWALISRDGAFGFAAEATDAATLHQTGTVDDPIHYRREGQEALGEVIATSIAVLDAGG